MDVSSNMWYFAYGSNLRSSIFLGKRAISPLQLEIVFLPNYELAFNVLNLPYSEPAMAGVVEKKGNYTAVFGIAYLLSPEDFAKVIRTEGAGVAYTILKVEAIVYSTSKRREIFTLVARRNYYFAVGRCPSARYMNLIIEGAKEQQLPEQYLKYLMKQRTYQLEPSAWRKAGRSLFDLIWLGPATWVQRSVLRFRSADGSPSPWFLALVDIVLWLIWSYHDFVHAPIFGRGDGS